MNSFLCITIGEVFVIIRTLAGSWAIVRRKEGRKVEKPHKSPKSLEEDGDIDSPDLVDNPMCDLQKGASASGGGRVTALITKQQPNYDQQV